MDRRPFSKVCSDCPSHTIQLFLTLMIVYIALIPKKLTRSIGYRRKSSSSPNLRNQRQNEFLVSSVLITLQKLMPSELWALLDPAAAVIEEQFFAAVHESPYGTFRTCRDVRLESAFRGKADSICSQ